MPTYQFEAMDSTGQEIKDVIEAPTEAEAQATIRQMGYFVTKISVKKERKKKAEKDTAKKKRGFAIGGVNIENADHVHPAAFDFARRRSADSAQPANSGRPAKARPAEKLA